MTEQKHHHRTLLPEDPAATKFNCATPIFSVADVLLSVSYYVDRLGFQLAWDWGDPPTFACVSRGDVTLFLASKGQGNRGTWLFIAVDNVDLLHSEYVRRGARITEQPADQPWGRREMLVEDPDGHCLRLASAPTGKS